MNQYTLEALAREKITNARQQGIRSQSARASAPRRPAVWTAIVDRIRRFLGTSAKSAAVPGNERTAAPRPGLG
jgi:hypothetical protein